jgi:hypothetical protein
MGYIKNPTGGYTLTDATGNPLADVPDELVPTALKAKDKAAEAALAPPPVDPMLAPPGPMEANAMPPPEPVRDVYPAEPPPKPEFNTVPNPNGGYDILDQGGVPIAFGVPTDWVQDRIMKEQDKAAAASAPIDEMLGGSIGAMGPGQLGDFSNTPQADMSGPAPAPEAGPLPTEEVPLPPPLPELSPDQVDGSDPTAPTAGLFNENAGMAPPSALEGATAEMLPDTAAQQNPSKLDAPVAGGPIDPNKIQWVTNPKTGMKEPSVPLPSLKPTPPAPSTTTPIDPNKVKWTTDPKTGMKVIDYSPAPIPAPAQVDPIPIGTAPAPAAAPPPAAGPPAPAPAAAPSVQHLADLNVRIGGGGPGRRVPESLNLVGGSMQQQIQQPIPPEKQAAYLQAIKDEDTRIFLEGERKQAMYDQQAADLAVNRLRSEDRIREVKEEQARRNAALAPKIQHMNEQRESLANMKVDPEHYWKEKSGFSRVVAVIASALGGWNAGVTGGPNRPYEMIRGAINDDIDAQKANIQVAKSAADLADNQLARELQIWMSPEAAENAVRLYQMQGADAELAKHAAESNSAAVKANADQMRSHLKIAQTELEKQIAEAEAGTLVKVSKLTPAHMTGGGGGYSVRDQMLKNYKYYKNIGYDEDSARDNAAKATSAQIEQVTTKTDAKGNVTKPGVIVDPGFVAGYNSVSIPIPGDPNKYMTLTGKEAKDYALSAAKNEAKYSSLAGNRAKAEMAKRAAIDLGQAVRLIQQIDVWEHAVLGAKAKIKQNPLSGWWSEEAKYAKYATDETRSQAFLSKLAPGTNLGTEQVKNLIPGTISLDSSIEGARKAFTGRVIHTLNGARAAANLPPVSEKQLREQQKAYLEAGTGFAPPIDLPPGVEAAPIE